MIIIRGLNKAFGEKIIFSNFNLEIPDGSFVVIYKKRASFVLIAASTIHDKSMTKETLDSYLKLVYENSCYEHDHIKKAVSWALREIGKTDFEYAEKILLTAYDLLASGNKVQIWIAKDVIKELETVVKVKERKRLITSNSKMGRER